MIEVLFNTSFKHPQALLLLGLIPFMLWYTIRKAKDKKPVFLISRSKALLENQSFRTRWTDLILLSLRLITITSVILALARPQISLKEEQVDAEAIDIMLVLDLSSSMLARDFNPDRLEVSKDVGIDFVNKRPHDRIGLVVFASEAFTQCPLTTDHAVLNDFLQKLECGLLDDGTAIGMGLATGINRLKESTTKSKIMILLTDGVNNAGYVQPETAAQLAKDLNVKIYAIGIGSTRDALAPVSRRSNGEYIFGLTPVEIDEELLNNMAQTTGGRYFRAVNRESLEKIYAEIDQLEKTKIEVTSFKKYAEAFFPFALLAIMGLIVEILLGLTLLF